jgi:hypothetical protein
VLIKEHVWEVCAGRVTTPLRGFVFEHPTWEESRTHEVWSTDKHKLAEFIAELRMWYLRHPHRKAVNHHMGVEWFQNISRKQAVVDGRVLVLFELWQLILPYVNHGCRSLAGASQQFLVL